MIQIQPFKDKRGKWRFRLVSKNHKILCSSEAYSCKRNCMKTAELIEYENMWIKE